MLFPNIEAERARLGLTKSALAKKIGVTLRTLSNWQSGRCEIPSPDVVTMAELFDCSTDYLLNLSDQRER